MALMKRSYEPPRKLALSFESWKTLLKERLRQDGAVEASRHGFTAFLKKGFPAFEAV